MTVRAKCPSCGNVAWDTIVYHRDTNTYECVLLYRAYDTPRGCGYTWRTNGSQEIDMGDDNDTLYCS